MYYIEYFMSNVICHKKVLKNWVMKFSSYASVMFEIIIKKKRQTFIFLPPSHRVIVAKMSLLYNNRFKCFFFSLSFFSSHESISPGGKKKLIKMRKK